MRAIHTLLGLSGFVLLSACSAAPGDESEGSQDEAVSTTYVSIQDFTNGGFYDDARSILGQLDAYCAASTCSKTYKSVRQLDIDCSVSSKRGSLNTCTWVLAGSREVVSAKTGVVTADDPYFLCKFKPTGTAASLITAFGDPSALTKPIPGLTTSLVDLLPSCLAHPVGAKSLPAAGSGSFEDATKYLGTSGAAGWSSMIGALDRTFDDICGDTFCGSDYGDMEPLSFRCSADKTTGQIGACLWVFGGSFAEVTASTGTVKVTTKPAMFCPIAVKGTVQELVSVLTAPGTTDAIQRPLPGVTTSAYDSLGGCLP